MQGRQRGAVHEAAESTPSWFAVASPSRAGRPLRMIEDRARPAGRTGRSQARASDGPRAGDRRRGMDDPEYVSAVLLKLAGALGLLETKAPLIEASRALDASASTGGFADVLLRRGAASVVAVDVGYGRSRRAQADPRVEVHDARRAVTLDPATVAPRARSGGRRYVFHFADVSATPACRCGCAAADFLPVVKPQFEIGKGTSHAAASCVPEHHVETVEKVARCAITTWGWISLRSPLRHCPVRPETSCSCTCATTTRIPSILRSSFDYIRRAVEAGPAGAYDRIVVDGSSSPSSQCDHERGEPRAQALQEQGIDVVDDASGRRY